MLRREIHVRVSSKAVTHAHSPISEASDSLATSGGPPLLPLSLSEQENPVMGVLSPEGKGKGYVSWQSRSCQVHR